MDLLIPEVREENGGRRSVIIEACVGVGDIAVLTGAVRDLHRAHPGRFAVEVRTTYPELWFYNPYLRSVSDRQPGVERVGCKLRHLVPGQIPDTVRYLELFLREIQEQLQIEVPPTQLSGDIHLSVNERLSPNPVTQRLGAQVPYWILGAGGKYDITTKWWSTARYQEVVDHFRDRILFVQVGLTSHHHPRLRGVLDFRGQTSLRELVRLMYAAQGVVCGVTSLMHLAAAVPHRTEDTPAHLRRPCVVIAGGREPALLTHYPDHQVIHNAGALNCSRGGCWKSRIQPLHDGSEFDQPEHRCREVAGDLPRCMDLIKADDVIRRIELFFEGGATAYLQGYQVETARRASPSQLQGSINQEITSST